MVSTHGYVTAHPPLGAEDTGGQVVYVLELSKRLAALGYEVDVWTRRFADLADVEPVSERVRILRVPCGGRAFIPKEYLYRHAAEWCEGARRLAREHDLTYDFVDSHYWDAGVMAARLARDLGVPHVHTPHSLGLWKRDRMLEDWTDGPEAMERKYNFRERIAHERTIAREAALVVATSHQQLDILASGYGVPGDHVAVVPPGYDDGRFFPVPERRRRAIRARVGWGDEPVVLAIGRLARNKGYDLLVDGFARLARRLPAARLHLAVGGTQRSPVEEAILQALRAQARSLGVERRVDFSGYVSDAELPDVYRAADCFVLSSRYEPFGMTAVEAMACGTPVVVTLHGGLHRALAVGSDALVADPLDAAALGDAVGQVLDTPRLRDRLRKTGPRRAKAVFTWDAVARQVLAGVRDRPATLDASGTFELRPGTVSPRSVVGRSRS